MKIVHLNTHSYGGAAAVARRLHRAALAHGIESELVTKFGLRTDPTPHFTPLRNARLWNAIRKHATNRYIYRAGKLVQNRLQHKNLVNRATGFDVFSPLNDREDFTNCTDSYRPDVIHLHWIAGFVDYRGFFEKNADKKFVWTLHDMNPFTGGCHYALGCEKFKQTCHACPQLAGTIDADYGASVLAGKIEALAALRDQQLVVVSPSRWLLDLARSSAVLRRFRHLHIENPALDATAAEPAAQFPGVPAGKKVVLFISDNLRNPRKGMSLLFDAARMLPGLDGVHFVGIGQRTDTPRGVPVTFLGSISDEQTLADYFATADAVVIPSNAENSPLVVIEALSSGTPVVAFAVGGIPELLDAENGVLVAERTSENLANALSHVLFRGQFDRTQIRARAARFGPQAVWEKYRALYTELLSA